MTHTFLEKDDNELWAVPAWAQQKPCSFMLQSYLLWDPSRWDALTRSSPDGVVTCMQARRGSGGPCECLQCHCLQYIRASLWQRSGAQLRAVCPEIWAGGRGQGDPDHGCNWAATPRGPPFTNGLMWNAYFPWVDSDGEYSRYYSQ